MTAGETWESCLDEIRALPAVKSTAMMLPYPCMSIPVLPIKGLTYPIECYFPTWVIPEDHKVTKSLEEALYKNLFGDERIGVDATAEIEKSSRPLTDKWTFSTQRRFHLGRNWHSLHGFGPALRLRPMLPMRLHGSRIGCLRSCLRCSAQCLLQVITFVYCPQGVVPAAVKPRPRSAGLQSRFFWPEGQPGSIGHTPFTLLIRLPFSMKSCVRCLFRRSMLKAAGTARGPLTFMKERISL